MPKLILLTKMLLLLGAPITDSASGSLAYYNDYPINNVCRYRSNQGWNDLNCEFPCQIASINNHIGEYWLVALPNCQGKTEYRLCLVVDCGNEEHLAELREKGEVLEISGRLARFCGYQDYVEDAMIWRLNNE